MSRRSFEMDDEEEYMKPILPTVPEKCGPPVISLGHLLDFAVQQIYHELTVLAELLPKKLDAERKISIVQFAHSSRTLFIKLLAVVKWVKTSKKFESCASICYFLDQQSQYFVDTADRLVQLAREELVYARLPAFQVPAAVDVLTLGTYPRLPLCIKSRFITEPPITPREEACILARLNQVIQSRISAYASKLPPRISKIHVKNGMVTLIVIGEFEVTLTLLGERESTKWTLLNIRILVDDYEIGYGTKLVHPLQVNMLHNVLQLRLDRSQEPLLEVYNFLHSFAQTLQLDVLFCQATQVLRGRMRIHANIEVYHRTEGILVIAYWLQRIQQNRLDSQYRMKIYIDKTNINSGLRIRHFPFNARLPAIDDRTGRLSILRLLSETLGVRCQERLFQLRELFGSVKPPVPLMLTGKAASTLTHQLLGSESQEDEVLILSVNEISGNLLAVVPALGSCQELRDLERCLNEPFSWKSIARILSRLRVLLMLERYRKAIAPLPVRMIPENILRNLLSGLPSLPPDRICLQFVKDDLYFLIVSFSANDEKGVSIDMHLLSNVERKVNVIRLHPSQVVNSARNYELCPIDCQVDMEPPAKKKKWLGDTRQLMSAVATVDDRLAFMRICEELERRNVKYRPLITEPTVGGLILHITDFSGAIPSGSDNFFSSMTNCCLRLDTRTRIIWPFECTLVDTPLIADFCTSIVLDEANNQRTKTTIMEIHGSGGVTAPNTAESVSTHMIDRLVVYSHMYDPVKEFAIAYYKTQKSNNNKQYFYLTFGIGAKQESVCQRPRKETLWNPHILLTQRLQDRFNRRPSLINLVQYLIDTITPLSALHAFTRIRLHSLRAFCQMMSYDASLAVTLQANLTVIDEYRIRLMYDPLHLEFLLLGDSKVGIRDCARPAPNANRLRQFCDRYISQELRSSHEERSPSAAGWMSSSSGPGSLPPHQVVRSPASRITASPLQQMSLSVPPADTNGLSLRQSPDSRSKSPILVDHAALKHMTAFDDFGMPHSDGSDKLRDEMSYEDAGVCPLDDYLFALSYLSRLGPALEGYRREHRGLGTHPVIQFRQLVSTAESVRLSVMGAAPPNLKHEPFVVNMNIFLDEETMKLKLKLDFEGEDVPSDNDILTAEMYFVRIVVRLGNEMAVIAFANACRLAVPGAFSAVARVMDAQMNWAEESMWRPSIQLVTWSQEGTVPRARISPGIVIDQTNISVLILLCLRPTRPNPCERNADASKHLIYLIYNTQTNTIARRSTGGDDDSSNATAVLSNVSEQYSISNECVLWPAINTLAHKFATTLQR